MLELDETQGLRIGAKERFGRLWNRSDVVQVRIPGRWADKGMELLEREGQSASMFQDRPEK